MKKEKITIICDCCDKDISPVANVTAPGYILKLSCYDTQYQALRPWDPWYPVPIEEDLYFCNLRCLKNWAIKLEI